MAASAILTTGPSRMLAAEEDEMEMKRNKKTKSRIRRDCGPSISNAPKGGMGIMGENITISSKKYGTPFVIFLNIYAVRITIILLALKML